MQQDLFGSDAYGAPIVLSPPAPTGEQLRDLALARVQSAAPAGWMDAALAAIQSLRGIRREITTDDLWELLPTPPEPRLMGAAVRQAALSGLLRKTDRVRPSVRPECHRRPVAIWEVVG